MNKVQKITWDEMLDEFGICAYVGSANGRVIHIWLSNKENDECFVHPFRDLTSNTRYFANTDEAKKWVEGMMEVERNIAAEKVTRYLTNVVGMAIDNLTNL